jgi:glycosidase
VKKEKANLNSHLNVFKRLTQMRKNKSVLQDGSLETIADNNLLIIKREIPGTQLFAVLNFGSSDQSIVLSDYFGTYKRNVVATVVSDNSKIRRG